MECNRQKAEEENSNNAFVGKLSSQYRWEWYSLGLAIPAVRIF